LTDKQLNPRDVFECEYIARHMAQDVYQDAKLSLESLRNGLNYDDEGVYRAFSNWIMGIDIDQEPIKLNRTGDIHIGGEILPEFSNDLWCTSCGATLNDGFHLGNCPTLKSKL